MLASKGEALVGHKLEFSVLSQIYKYYLQQPVRERQAIALAKPVMFVVLHGATFSNNSTRDNPFLELEGCFTW